MSFLAHLLRPLDQASFAKEIDRELAKRGQSKGIRVDAQELVLHFGDDRTFYLGNLYEEYRRTGAFRRARVFEFVIQQALATAPEVPEDFLAARKGLMPSVRDPLTFDLQRLRLPVQAPGADASKLDPVWQPLGDDYSVSLVFDGPQTMSYLNRDQFKTWDVPFERALEYALDNLAARPFRQVLASKGLWGFDTSDSYDSARLLLLDLMRSLDLRGRPVAVIPNRELLLVAGEDDPEGLEALVELATERFNHPRCIGTAPLVLDGDTWRAFRPDGDDPLHVQLRNMSVRNLGTRYAEQKQVLEKLQEQVQEGPRVVADSLGFVKEATQVLHTYCIWGAGVPTLLPRTEWVALVKGEIVSGDPGSWALYPWDAVLAEAGPLMKAQGLTPERWAVDGFPSSESLARLAPHAVTL
ncbi:MAG: hypothetical protein HY901_33140 [Deltaproteobacteria bacterium]|nr:hypothetical protein [Deltaproteobacteria bacterium]